MIYDILQHNTQLSFPNWILGVTSYNFYSNNLKRSFSKKLHSVCHLHSTYSISSTISYEKRQVLECTQNKLRTPFRHRVFYTWGEKKAHVHSILLLPLCPVLLQALRTWTGILFYTILFFPSLSSSGSSPDFAEMFGCTTYTIPSTPVLRAGHKWKIHDSFSKAHTVYRFSTTKKSSPQLSKGWKKVFHKLQLLASLFSLLFFQHEFII